MNGDSAPAFCPIREKARERSRLQEEKRAALKMEFPGEDPATW